MKFPSQDDAFWTAQDYWGGLMTEHLCATSTHLANPAGNIQTLVHLRAGISVGE